MAPARKKPLAAAAAALPPPLLVLLVLLAAGGARGECPQPADLKNEDGSKLCARMYTDDNAYYAQCCSGNELLVPPGEDQPYMTRAFHHKVSSLVVAQRCQVTVWSDKGKGGNSRVFKTGTYPRLQEYKRGLFHDWDDAIAAYYCTCS